MELREQGWTATVERDPFGEILLSGLAVIAVFLAAGDGANAPNWLHLDPGLSALCFILAFQRVRQARLVEEATSRSWDEVASVWGPRSRGADAVLEGTYQLGLHALPFSSLSVTVFLPVLLLTELSTIGHQVLFLRSHARYFRARGYQEEPMTDVRRLFRWRLQRLLLRSVLVVALTAVAWSRLGSWGATVVAIGLGIALIDALVLEPMTSPRHDEPAEEPLRLEVIDDAARLGPADRARLGDVFNRSFPDAGVTAAEIIDRVGSNGHELLVARLGSDPVGLLAFQRDADAIAFLWWAATDPRRRRRRVATTMAAAVVKHLGTIPLLLFEADLLTGDPGDMEARRALARSVGAQPIPGLRWGPTKAPELYDVFVVPNGPGPDPGLVRPALERMARFSLRDDATARDAALERIAHLDDIRLALANRVGDPA